MHSNDLLSVVCPNFVLSTNGHVKIAHTYAIHGLLELALLHDNHVRGPVVCATASCWSFSIHSVCFPHCCLYTLVYLLQRLVVYAVSHDLAGGLVLRMTWPDPATPTCLLWNSARDPTWTNSPKKPKKAGNFYKKMSTRPNPTRWIFLKFRSDPRPHPLVNPTRGQLWSWHG